MEGAEHTENTENDTSADHTEAIHDDRVQPGQRFHMDMDFVRGTKYAQRDINGNLVTSIDGYNSYLLIVDRATRYTWVFLARTKTPPISTIMNS
jgi:malate synthase